MSRRRSRCRAGVGVAVGVGSGAQSQLRPETHNPWYTSGSTKFCLLHNLLYSIIE